MTGSAYKSRLRVFLKRGLTAFMVVIAVPYPVIGQMEIGQADTLHVGQEAPTFSLFEMYDGESRFYLSHFTGQPSSESIARGVKPRVIILSFFSSTCAPCEREMPVLTRISRQYAGRDLMLIFIATRDTFESVLEWLAVRPQIGGLTLFDPYGVVADRYQIVGVPWMFIIDRDRIIRHIERGYHAEGYEERVTRILDQLLNTPGR